MLQKLLLVLGIFCFVSSVTAAPVIWPISSGGNGHAYDFVVSPDIKWSDANAGAQALTLGTVHGNLATITSASENAFMAATFPTRGGSDQNGWLGGFQDASAPDFSEPNGGWRWVTGEPFIYTNWFPGMPDNSGGSQNFIRSNVGWQWDDLENDPFNGSIQSISGYFVEYPVPEPASLTLLAVGSAMLLGRKRPRDTKGAGNQ